MQTNLSASKQNRKSRTARTSREALVLKWVAALDAIADLRAQIKDAKHAGTGVKRARRSRRSNAAKSRWKKTGRGSADVSSRRNWRTDGIFGC